MSERLRLTHELERAFRQIFRQLKREINEVLGDEINRSEFVFLKFLVHHGPQKPSTLSSEFEVAASHVTHVTDRLVKKGWVRRRRSESDKRAVELEVTTEGKSVYHQLEKKWLLYFSGKFDSFTTEEMETLLRLFQKLTGASNK
ncbi:DNA-binding MarR family transcriptional regulator [Melghirimyces profundicolus]|uniref:DNA-binding MarR family transcriptional regulator n=1 Tax=Melghirimyces profundicolus TaxID=1242148 RepID=A0A2T6C4C7_9BACL|nr:MarR family transcriptional regulator [Melghirimyces profundicolus]PTX63180.1 DNA-binding MarR family transcriptional regulator [Melghirimyces profundicolus]